MLRMLKSCVLTVNFCALVTNFLISQTLPKKLLA